MWHSNCSGLSTNTVSGNNVLKLTALYSFFLGDYTYLGCCDRTSNLCSWCSFDNQSKLFRDQGTNLASHSSESHSEYRHLICSHINCQLLNVPGSKGHSHWPCLLLPSFTASFVSVRTSIVKIKKASAPNAKIFSFTLRFLFAHSDKSWEGMLRGMFHHFVRSWRFLGTAWAKIGFQAFCSKKKVKLLQNEHNHFNLLGLMLPLGGAIGWL